MPKFRENRSLPYEAELVNKVILDVEKYPDFLPWCKGAKIISQDTDSFIAEMIVSFKGFTERYRSQIKFTHENGEYTIKVNAISGPFKKLNNTWHIISIEEGCVVDFFIDFEFKSKILDMVIGVVFSIATEKMIVAFEERARMLSV